MKIQILLYDGFDELDAIGPFEVFRIADTKGIDVHAELVTLTPDHKQVSAQRGLVIQCSNSIVSESPPDILLIPGGGWANRASLGAWNEYQKGNIPELIAHLYQKGVVARGPCS